MRARSPSSMMNELLVVQPGMVIRVLFFGVLKDVMGREDESLSLREGATVADLLAHYDGLSPRLHPWLNSLAVSVNQDYGSQSTPLHAGDEVALLPPVSGGGPERAEAFHCAIVGERIDTAKLADSLKRGEDGAVVVFEGIVRNHTRGRRTLYLDYEAYEVMALAQMRSLLAEARGRFPVRDAAIVHRVGRLAIGDTSVAIAVVSTHRAAAFDACRWIIDTLKKTVPIWKKEYFEDGAVWADGEPFPDGVAAGNPATPVGGHKEEE